MDTDQPIAENGFMRRSRQKRERIIGVAAGLFAASGIKKVSVKDIAKAAGVSQVTVFKYFSSKTGLVEAVMMSFIEKRMAECRQVIKGNEPFLERFNGLMTLLAQNAGAFHGEYTGILMRDHPQLLEHIMTERRRLFHELTVPFLNEGRSSGSIDPDISDEMVLIYSEVVVAGMAARIDLLPDVLANQEKLAQLMKLICHGFLAKKQ
jgi:AcrR family transcriptional regulator